MIVPIELLPPKPVKYDITIDTLPALSFDTKVVVVTNPTVAALHLDTLLAHIDAPQLHVVKVPDGEQYKTLETVEYILNECFEQKLDRKSLYSQSVRSSRRSPACSLRGYPHCPPRYRRGRRP